MNNKKLHEMVRRWQLAAEGEAKLVDEKNREIKTLRSTADDWKRRYLKAIQLEQDVAKWRQRALDLYQRCPMSKDAEKWFKEKDDEHG